MFNYSNLLWTFPAYHMDACKEKYYGNTYRLPEHFREPKKLEDPSSPGHSSYVCFIRDLKQQTFVSHERHLIPRGNWVEAGVRGAKIKVKLLREHDHRFCSLQ